MTLVFTIHFIGEMIHAPLRILITMPPDPPAYDALKRDPGLELTLLPEPTGGHGLDLLPWPSEWLRDKDVLLCSGVLPKNFHEFNALRWVQMGSAGYELAIDRKIGEHNQGSVKVTKPHDRSASPSNQPLLHHPSLCQLPRCNQLHG